MIYWTNRARLPEHSPWMPLRSEHLLHLISWTRQAPNSNCSVSNPCDKGAGSDSIQIAHSHRPCRDSDRWTLMWRQERAEEGKAKHSTSHQVLSSVHSSTGRISTLLSPYMLKNVFGRNNWDGNSSGSRWQPTLASTIRRPYLGS